MRTPADDSGSTAEPGAWTAPFAMPDRYLRRRGGDAIPHPAGHPSMTSGGLHLIRPDWPAPARVRACSTERAGGVSAVPYDSLNLGARAGDRPADVAENRRRLAAAAECPAPVWLDQVHGPDVVRLGCAPAREPAADASVTGETTVTCAILTADCLPVLLCDRAGTRVGAAHAGWRGLAAGVVEAAVSAMDRPAGDLLAWLGPCIGPTAFEVGPEVRAAFLAGDPAAGADFRPGQGDRFYADLRALARRRLLDCGVRDVSASTDCTLEDAGRFFSHRRDGPCGRMATLIWLAP
jgi:YfiH family protein